MERKPAEIIAQSSYFDVDYYVKTYSISKKINPAEHYLLYGWKLCYDPSNSFSTSGYLYSNPDVLRARVNPLLHYEKAGRSEKRSMLTSFELICSTKIFDPYFYIERDFNCNAEMSEDDLVLDYLNDRWKSNPPTNSKYDLTEYINSLPKEEKNCIPVLHYIVFGCKADRKNIERKSVDDIDLIAGSQLFNEKFYRERYNVSRSLNAARHYLEYGARRFYDPSDSFSTSGYYYKNHDVYKKDINPLVHYERSGKNEHREWLSTRSVVLTSDVFDANYYCAKYLFDCIDEKQYEQWAVNDFITNAIQNARMPYKSFKAAENQSIWSTFISLILDPDSIQTEDLSIEKEIEIVRRSNLFDKIWYNERYNLASEIDGVIHYCTEGYKLKCDPSLNFCTEEYVDLYKKELGEEVNPLVHYELYGKQKKISDNKFCT